MSEYDTRSFYGGGCRWKDSWPRWHSLFEVPQTSSNKLSPASKQIPGRSDANVSLYANTTTYRCARRRVANGRFEVSNCLYIEGKGSVLKGLPHVWVEKILCCQRQEDSLLNMSNNEISHYNNEKSLQMQPVWFCNQRLCPRCSAELTYLEKSLLFGNGKFYLPMKRWRYCW